MILWLVLLGLVIITSYVLAVKSMRDVALSPHSRDYGLFLIRNKQGLTDQTFISIYAYLQKTNLSISFERLFKGGESALVIFGPRKLLMQLAEMLDLLELEDYTKIKEGAAWEVGIKGDVDRLSSPQLMEDEQVWWQVILWTDSKKRSDVWFKPQIRVVKISADPSLLELPDNLVKLPKAFSNQQVLAFYQKRSFQKDNENISLNLNQIQKFLRI